MDSGIASGRIERRSPIRPRMELISIHELRVLLGMSIIYLFPSDRSMADVLLREKPEDEEDEDEKKDDEDEEAEEEGEGYSE
jgi:hypothetical protein